MKGILRNILKKFIAIIYLFRGIKIEIVALYFLFNF